MNEEEKIDEIQKTLLEVKKNDLEESPDAQELFTCSSCGQMKILAGSIPYAAFLFCNECAILTEVALYLGKIKRGDEMVQVMEQKRIDAECQYLRDIQKFENN